MKVYNYKEIKSILKNEYNIKINLARKKIFKIEKGLYSDTKDVDELTILFKKYPGIILTLESAFFYYDLSSIKPNKIVVGTRRNFTRIKNPKVKQVFYSNARLDENEYNEENASSLSEYRKKYIEQLTKNENFCWPENRNRMGPIKKIVKNTIIDQEKNICVCCNRNTINRWYEQCYYCRWIADYVQESNDADCDEKGPNKYALW